MTAKMKAIHTDRVELGTIQAIALRVAKQELAAAQAQLSSVMTEIGCEPDTSYRLDGNALVKVEHEATG